MILPNTHPPLPPSSYPPFPPHPGIVAPHRPVHIFLCFGQGSVGNFRDPKETRLLLSLSILPFQYLPLYLFPSFRSNRSAVRSSAPRCPLLSGHTAAVAWYSINLPCLCDILSNILDLHPALAICSSSSIRQAPNIYSRGAEGGYPASVFLRHRNKVSNRPECLVYEI